MKLSEVRGESTLDVLADLIEPVSSIMGDERTKALFEKSPTPEGKTAEEAAAERLRNAVPGIIRSHKGDVIAILAAVKQVSRSEYEEGLNLATLMADLYELVNDEEFVSFFSSVVTD